MKEAQASEHLKQIIELQSLLVSLEFDLATFMNIAVERLQKLTGATGAVIELKEGDEMVYKAVSGTVAPYLGFRIKMAGSLAGLCVSKGEIMISDDTSNDSRVDADACKKVKAASMIVVPLYRRGQIVGVLKTLSTKTKAFDADDINALQLIAGLLGGALGQQLEIEQRRQLEEKLLYMAQNDALTGLPNRSLFHDRLAHALHINQRKKGLLALMYIDIDHFKEINDKYGHDIGDGLLKAFAANILNVIRASDSFARMGGDEFTLIAENLSKKEDVEIIADKILKAANREFTIEENKINTGVSIGIAINAGEAINYAAFIKQADSALYEAKRAGRNCFREFL